MAATEMEKQTWPEMMCYSFPIPSSSFNAILAR